MPETPLVDINTLAAELTIPTAANVPAPVPSEPQHITLRRHNGQLELHGLTEGAVINLNTIRHQDKALVVSLLPKASQALINKRRHGSYRDNYTSLARLINEYQISIPLQHWADALSAVIMRHRSAQEETAVSELGADGAYLAVGSYLYRLNPVARVSTNKAIAAMRRRIMDATRDQAQSIIATAEQNARAIQLAAQQMRQQAQREAEEARRQAQTMDFPPASLVSGGAAVRYRRTHQWEVQLSYTFRIVSFRFHEGDRTSEWPAEPADSFDVKMWLPFSTDPASVGSYAITSAYMDREGPTLPHASHQISCLAPQGLPQALRTAEDVANIAIAIRRTYSIVQLNSLLRCYPSEWDSKIKKFVPAALQGMLRGGSGYLGVLHELHMAQQGEAENTRLVVTDQQEDDATWRA